MKLSQFKTITGRVHSTYHLIRSWEPIWYWWFNSASRRVWKKHKPVLNYIEEKIVGDLKKDGIATSHITELFPDSQLLEEFTTFVNEQFKNPAVKVEMMRKKELIAERIRRGSTAGKEKDFRMKPWWVNYMADIDFNNSFVRFGLSDTFIKIAGGYMDFAPTFVGMGIMLNLPVPEGTPEYLSQQWHRDPDDKRILKMFLYLNDVTDESEGPFCYVKKTHFGGKWRNVYPQRLPAGRYPPRGAVEKTIPHEDIKVCFGKAGTIVFADTTGFNKDGYCTSKPGLMFDTVFCSRATTLTLKHYVVSEEKRKGLSQLARFALYL